MQVRRCSTAACLAFAAIHGTANHGINAADCGLSDKLYAALRDSDPIVVANSLVALEHVLAAEGGVVINKPIAQYLLSKLHQYSDSNLEIVLTFLKKYSPREKEVFHLLNPLDSCFQTDNAAVLVAAVELFLEWTVLYPNLKVELLKIIQPSFCRIFINSGPETCFLLGEFLSSFGPCVRQVFEQHYKYFIPKPNDQGFLKEKKINIIQLIASPINVEEFVEELYPYCSDFSCYRSAINCLCSLAQISEAGKYKVFSVVPSLLESTSENIVIAALECVCKVVSCINVVKTNNGIENKSTATVLNELTIADYDDTFNTNETTSTESKSTAKLSKDLKNDILTCDSVVVNTSLPEELTQSLAKVISMTTISEKNPTLVLHLIAQLCLYLNNSISVLEHLQQGQGRLDPSSECVLVSTAAKVFLRKPSQMHVILQKILQSALARDHPAVRKKAALVYAVLQQSPAEAGRLLGVQCLG